MSVIYIPPAITVSGGAVLPVPTPPVITQIVQASTVVNVTVVPVAFPLLPIIGFRLWRSPFVTGPFSAVTTFVQANALHNILVDPAPIFAATSFYAASEFDTSGAESGLSAPVGFLAQIVTSPLNAPVVVDVAQLGASVAAYVVSSGVNPNPLSFVRLYDAPLSGGPYTLAKQVFFSSLRRRNVIIDPNPAYGRSTYYVATVTDITGAESPFSAEFPFSAQPAA